MVKRAKRATSAELSKQRIPFVLPREKSKRIRPAFAVTENGVALTPIETSAELSKQRTPVVLPREMSKRIRPAFAVTENGVALAPFEKSDKAKKKIRRNLIRRDAPPSPRKAKRGKK